jgi:hypothetical protein
MRSLDSLTSGIKPITTRLKSLVRDPSRRFASFSNSNCVTHSPRHIKTRTLLPEYSFDTDRKKVLKHHPDKKATIAGETNDDAFFKCIQKAMDVLTNSERRRQFDSVDPHYPVSRGGCSDGWSVEGQGLQRVLQGFRSRVRARGSIQQN